MKTGQDFMLFPCDKFGVPGFENGAGASPMSPDLISDSFCAEIFLPGTFCLELALFCLLNFHKGSRQKLLSGFFPLRGYPSPPYRYHLSGKYFCSKKHSKIGGYPAPPLTENHPAQKPLAEMGVPPPPYPPNGQSFSQKTLSGKGGYPPPPP